MTDGRQLTGDRWRQLCWWPKLYHFLVVVSAFLRERSYGYARFLFTRQNLRHVLKGISD